MRRHAYMTTSSKFSSAARASCVGARLVRCWPGLVLLGLMAGSLWAEPAGDAQGEAADDRLAPTQVIRLDVPARAARFASVRRDIESAFPRVKHVGIAEYLADMSNVLLVDVRARAEYEVSRIPGAVHSESGRSLAALVAANPDKQVLLYCSLGWRSAEAAQVLLDHGATNVRNLHGSIFEWGNRGLPLEDDAGVAASVHPYSFYWGWRYLDPALHPDKK